MLKIVIIAISVSYGLFSQDNPKTTEEQRNFKKCFESYTQSISDSFPEIDEVRRWYHNEQEVILSDLQKAGYSKEEPPLSLRKNLDQEALMNDGIRNIARVVCTVRMLRKRKAESELKDF